MGGQNIVEEANIMIDQNVVLIRELTRHLEDRFKIDIGVHYEEHKMGFFKYYLRTDDMSQNRLHECSKSFLNKIIKNMNKTSIVAKNGDGICIQFRKKRKIRLKFIQNLNGGRYE